MDIGELDQRITLQAPPVAQDALGAPTGAWTDVCTVWARVRGLTGREFFEAQQMQMEGSYKFVIRYRVVNPIWRIVWNGQFFEQQAPASLMMGRKEFLELRGGQVRGN